jgi:hypothetical protein
LQVLALAGGLLWSTLLAMRIAAEDAEASEDSAAGALRAFPVRAFPVQAFPVALFHLLVTTGLLWLLVA